MIAKNDRSTILEKDRCISIVQRSFNDRKEGSLNSNRYNDPIKG